MGVHTFLFNFGPKNGQHQCPWLYRTPTNKFGTTNYAIHPTNAKTTSIQQLPFPLNCESLYHRTPLMVRNIYENTKGITEDTGASISSHLYYSLFQISARYELYNVTSQKPLLKNLCGYWEVAWTTLLYIWI
jgi:hypothetical protein